ncbi:hypothetical protein BDV96DRAFT_20442 [Lophiotrema nucula]|uniref:Uncharacterized protein n=1 Tax=Lophiotrema nucula TaxID=690887 RepID=A0A6A5ZE46_9PLEO|nr:hypothetical protein BDV96DRAFT_20442 [Lophiotrema nucula]
MMAVTHQSCFCNTLPPKSNSKSKSEPTKKGKKVQGTLHEWLNKSSGPAASKVASQAPRLDPSIPSPDGTCHFLRLPLELLDDIYRIVLTEENGLYSLPTTGRAIAGGFNRQSTKLFTCACGVQEANRLKYVCRQLWLQTRGLGLRYNDVHFNEGSERVSVCEQFFRFVDFCSPANKHHMQAVLHEDPLPPNERYSPETWEQLCQMEVDHAWQDCWRMHDVIEFCWTHPNARVIYRPKALASKGHPFLFLIKACAIAQALRGSVLQPMLLPSDDLFDTVERSVEKLQDGRDSSVLDAPNFRVLPVEENFVPEIFMHGANKGSDVMRIDVWNTIRRVDGGLQTIMEWVSEWYERGI